ncbi:MAG: hypothetical protein HFI55_04095 [Lachnospiraceae bacterium]|jgi:pilus assembly protein FimV|nr:hypothetical protein [Lachnospiraceae bacterium]
MSSSEEYLDSLLDSILGGGKADGEEEVASGAEGEGSQTAPVDGGKAMSSQEIEEMLLSMGTLGGEEELQEQGNSDAEDMEAMLAFMNEHSGASASGDGESSLDDFGLEEGMLSDDFTLEETDADAGMTDGLDFGENGADESGMNDFSLDGLDLGESGADESGMNDFSLDGLDLGESGADESGMNDFSLDGLDLGESGADESGMDDFSLDGLDLGESGADESGMDDFSLDGLDLGESGADESAMDDFSLDGLDLGESGADESTMDDFSLDGLDLGESDGDEGALDELSLDGLDLGGSGADESTLDNFSLDDLALEESESADDEMDGLMSEEDIDRLLSGDLSDGEDGVGDFALEETGESDEDLSALLAGMDHDEDLSEIGDLLAESDHGVSPDDDMLEMLEGVDGGGDSSFDFFENDEAAKEAEGIRELTPEEIAAREGGVEPGKEKKKRKKLFGKKKKKGRNEEAAAEEAGDELELLLAETSEQEPKAEEEGEKKPGVFARFMNFLLEADEDEDPVAAEVLADNDGEMGTVTDENRALLDELDEEDKKGKKKKKKDKKKGKKGKGGEEGEEAAEGEEEESKKPKKKKKKEKKKKQEEEVDLFAPPEKKLSKKKVITVFMFCGTIAVCIVLLSSFLPVYMEKKDAQMAYDHQDYAQVYDLLYGKDLNEQDEILYQRSNLILQMNRKLSSYENYGSLDMRLESLNALISGVERYQEILPEAETYNVVGEVSAIYGQILERLSADFGVSEQDALEIIAAEDDVIYSQRLEAIINGAVSDEEISTGRQDILPEEEEIIERIDGLEPETEADQTIDAQTDEPSEEDMLPEEVMTDLESDETEAEDSLAGENVEADMSADENGDEGAE